MACTDSGKGGHAKQMAGNECIVTLSRAPCSPCHIVANLYAYWNGTVHNCKGECHGALRNAAMHDVLLNGRQHTC